MKTDYTRKLRHIQPVGATFFVTFHLFGAVSQAELTQIKHEGEAAIAEVKRLNAPDLWQQIYLKQREAFLKYEQKLESNRRGPHDLKNPRAARIVADKLHEYDGKLYALEAYAIMSNHVHVLLDLSLQILSEEQSLDRYLQLHQVLKQLKGASARALNTALNRKGTFWGSESWDRYIRNQRHWYAARDYIAYNPVKAGLCQVWTEHPFTWLRPDE